MPDTLEEFATSKTKTINAAPVAVSKPAATVRKFAKKKEEIFETEKEVSDYENEDDFIEDEADDKVKPAKRASKAKSATDSKKAKSESESVESIGTDAEATPKKKFK